MTTRFSNTEVTGILIIVLRRKPDWRDSRKLPVDRGLSRKKHAGSWRGTWTRLVYFKLKDSAACVQADGHEPAHRERLEIQEREGLIQEQSSRSESRAVPGKSEVEGAVPADCRGGARAVLR